MKPIAGFLILVFFACCNAPQQKVDTMKNSYAKGSFGYDLEFLQQHDSVIVLKNGDAQVIVSAKYQGKVFTSTADGMNGNSFGWIHYSAFDGPVDQHMNAYGGENRLWLGPEGGKFSLFFPKDAAMEFAHWKTPAAIDTEPWVLDNKSDTAAHLKKEMQVVNYTGTSLHMLINRSVTILSNAAMNNLLGINTSDSVKAVGYQTENRLTNTGSAAWNEESGMPCIWMLDMFNPSDNTTVVIPYTTQQDIKPATTDYFGEIAADRIKLQQGVLFFKADGRSRGKLGIHPAASKNIAGSYDAGKKILTLALFDIDTTAKYLNQEWNTSKPPFSGDAVNAYNDGPLADGKQMGPFYEIESVSPAAFLKPGETLSHKHAVFHFTGAEKELNLIAQKTLGITLNDIINALH